MYMIYGYIYIYDTSVHIYIYVHMHIYIYCIYIYIYTYHHIYIYTHIVWPFFPTQTTQNWIHPLSRDLGVTGSLLGSTAFLAHHVTPKKTKRGRVGWLVRWKQAKRAENGETRRGWGWLVGWCHLFWWLLLLLLLLSLSLSLSLSLLSLLSLLFLLLFLLLLLLWLWLWSSSLSLSLSLLLLLLLFFSTNCCEVSVCVVDVGWCWLLVADVGKLWT